VFSLLVLGALDVSVSGEMNNDRLFFFLMSLPFVLRQFISRDALLESFHTETHSLARTGEAAVAGS
jgi:hypothetical protein